ncbi:MAG: alpha/beta fold hydrolase [Alphaproteobacteria bacterium]|nr:alpha/beta fold hydrolase [Alphaproteobacteria bacterium]
MNTANALAAAAIPWASDPAQKEAALKAVSDMTEQMLAGLKAYQATIVQQGRQQRQHVWQDGSTKLLQVNPAAGNAAPPVLLVPSLINRHDILDLDAQHSFAEFLAGQGYAPFILEWGQPAATEKKFRIDDYIRNRLYPALEMLHKKYGPVHVVGYCMGGTMAAGAVAALDKQNSVRSLTLLAAPWDFEAGDKTVALRMHAFTNAAAGVMEATGTLPVDWIQALFASIDPLFAFNKFRAFADMKPDSPEARRFIIVEDWLNDGVDLAAPAALQALQEWYVDNQPYNGVWTIGSKMVDAENIKVPTLVVAASNDKLVPAQSALAIVQQIDACQSMSPEVGHIGMMASTRAAKLVWQPIADFLNSVT